MIFHIFEKDSATSFFTIFSFFWNISIRRTLKLERLGVSINPTGNSAAEMSDKEETEANTF